jgi:hypothetical protein
MFSDFKQHVTGVSRIAPVASNVTFDGPGQREGLGLEHMNGNEATVTFWTNPIRNALQQSRITSLPPVILRQSPARISHSGVKTDSAGSLRLRESAEPHTLQVLLLSGDRRFQKLLQNNSDPLLNTFEPILL